MGNPRRSSIALTPPAPFSDTKTRRLPPHFTQANKSTANVLRSISARSTRGLLSLIASFLAAASSATLASSPPAWGNEGYAGGEMKHGPIALIDEKMPVVIAPKEPHVAYEKIIGNIEKVRARGGKIIAVIDENDQHAATLADHVIRIPAASALLALVVATIRLQLLAYLVTKMRGNDVDQPRNLSRSVTVK